MAACSGETAQPCPLKVVCSSLTYRNSTRKHIYLLVRPGLVLTIVPGGTCDANVELPPRWSFSPHGPWYESERVCDYDTWRPKKPSLIIVNRAALPIDVLGCRLACGDSVTLNNWEIPSMLWINYTVCNAYNFDRDFYRVFRAEQVALSMRVPPDLFDIPGTVPTVEITYPSTEVLRS